MSSAAVDRASFVAAIRAEPDREDLRRVFADWLLDRGDERGELINLELDLAAGAAGWDARQRCDELLAVHRERWLRPLENLGAFRPELERGFVTSVSLTGRALANLDAICELEPVTGATLNSGGHGPSRIAAESPALADMRWLILAGRHAGGVEAILGSPGLGRLESLSVFHDLTEELAAALVGGPARPTSLTISPDWKAAHLLALSRLFERVESLSWHGPPGTLVALALSPLPPLRSLRAEHLTAQEFTVVVQLERLERLECSDLYGGAIDIWIEHTWGRLRHLVIPLDDDDDQVKLLGSSALAGVETLDMQATVLCPAAIAALRDNPHRGALRSIWLPDHPTRDRFEIPGVEIEWEGW